MEELATEGVHRNCLEIRNNIPNKDSVRVLHEVDLSTPVSTSQPPYISNSRKSATPGSVSRQLAASAMLSGASRLNAGDTPSSTSQSQSERNSSEKTASDCEATAVARTRGPTDGNFAADFGMADQLATNSKLVLEPRVRDKQSGKQRLFEVPLNDDASSGEDFPIPSTVSKRSGKRNRTRNGSSQKPRNQGHQVQASSADAAVDDDTNNTLSTSTSNPNSNQRRPVGALPSLEDGLSSASPTESTEDEPDTDERTANGSGKQQQRRTRTKKRSIKQRTNPTEAQTQNNDTLLNLSLVREINDEIDSLKRTFLYEAAQHAAMSPETEVPTESACAIPQLPPPPSVNTSSNGDRRDVECVTNGSAKLIDTDTPTRAADSVPVPVPVLSNENKDLDNDATLPPMPTVTLNAHGILKNDADAARCSDSVSASVSISASDRLDASAFCADFGQPLPLALSAAVDSGADLQSEPNSNSNSDSQRLARFFSLDQPNMQHDGSTMPSLEDSPTRGSKQHRFSQNRSSTEQSFADQPAADRTIPQSQSTRFNPFNTEAEAEAQPQPNAAPAEMNVLPCYMYCTHCGTVSVHHLIPAYGPQQPVIAHPQAMAPSDLQMAAPVPVPVPVPVPGHGHGHTPSRHVHGANCTCHHAHTPSPGRANGGVADSRPRTLNPVGSRSLLQAQVQSSRAALPDGNQPELDHDHDQSLHEGAEETITNARAAQKTADRKSRDVYRKDFDSDEEEEGLMGKQYKRPEENRLDIPELRETKQVQDEKRKKKIREVYVRHPENPEVLLEGVLFRTRYLGSTQLISDTHTTKYTRMLQAQSALEQIKAPDGESQPSVDVELFVSADKLLILNTNLKEILMDHPLRTVSFIADIGDVVVIMARRRLIAPGEDGQMLGSPNSADEILPNSRNGLRSSGSDLSRSASGDSTASRSSTSDVGSLRRQIDLGKMQAKVVCHVIECDDAQLVAQSIGQAFQVAYVEFLKANGIDEPPAQADVDYQDVLNSQEMFNEELRLFTSTDFQKDVLIPKAKSEPLGVVIVESGWGSVIPTVVLANMDPRGAAARCGQLNIGDQIMSVNGISLVGLPLATCQNHIKNVRGQTSVKLAVISCPPVVEVLIKRPDPKYQLGFSVQNGVICSLLRGGIAERGGVRVGHRIIEINGQSVVAVQHEKIVQMLSGAVGEIHMRTMPTTIFRLLTGQDTPHYI